MTFYQDLDELEINAVLVVTEKSTGGKPIVTVEHLVPVEPGEKLIFGFSNAFIKDHGLLYGEEIRIGVSRFRSLGFSLKRNLYLGVQEP